MIPETWAALLALLGLVAPGLVFQLRRERRRPAFAETTFREISRVALSSLVFTTASLVLLLLLAQVWPTLLPDVARWTSDPAYVRDDYLRVGLFLGLEVLVACALALVVEATTAGELDSRMASGSVWYRVLDRDKPTDATRVWLWVTLQDGSQYKGSLRAYDTGSAKDVREIAIGGSPIRYAAAPVRAEGGAPGAGAGEAAWTELAPFDAVILPADQVRAIAVQYLAADGTSLRAAPPVAPSGWRRLLGGTVRRRPSR